MSEPLFTIGDEVVFTIKNRELEGTVKIVDYRGYERKWFEGCDWSYDILVNEHPDFGGSPCLCKHIPECYVHPVQSDGAEAAPSPEL